MFIKVKATNLLNAIAGRKPSIDRTNEYLFNRKGQYYVGPSESGKFLGSMMAFVYGTTATRSGTCTVSSQRTVTTL